MRSLGSSASEARPERPPAERGTRPERPPAERGTRPERPPAERGTRPERPPAERGTRPERPPAERGKRECRRGPRRWTERIPDQGTRVLVALGFGRLCMEDPQW